jgi:D-serine deaminase-like pyridoxal phosphate-dependent protein
MQNTNQYQYYRDIFEKYPLPLAFVDMDMLDKNIAEVLRRAGGKPVRIASKSIRCKFIMDYILKSSNRFQGIMCYSANEAQWLSQQGFDDLLVAYPTLQKNDIINCIEEIKKEKKIYLMTDSAEHLEVLNQIAEKQNIVLPICIDLDMSGHWSFLHFGVYRSGIRDEKSLRHYLEKLKHCKNLKLHAAMGYEAQIAGLGNNSPGKFLFNKLITLLQKYSIKEVAQRRKRMVEIIKNVVPDFEIVNGGGTGSLETTGAEPWVTELTAGSAFYAPALFDNYKKFKHLPAAGFAIEVVRNPQKNIYTCLGGGYVASGKTGNEKAPAPYLPEGMKLIENEMAGEVQTPIQYNGKLNLGEPVFFRHSKAGELCEHFDKLCLIRKGAVVDIVDTYRGEGQCFIG